MKVQQEEYGVTVIMEDRKIKFDSEWMSEEPKMLDGQVKYMKKWKINLIEEHGVDINEL